MVNWHKRYLVFLISLFFPSIIWASGLLINSHSFGVSSPPSYLIEESFEASEFDNTTPCGAVPCVDQRTSPSPNGDKATTGLDMAGSYCLELDATAWLELDFTDESGALYVLGKFRYEDALEADENFVIFYDTDAAFMRAYARSTGTFRVNAGSYSSETTATHSADNSIWVKFRATKGTGANAELCISVWDGSWESWTCASDGTGTADQDKVRFTNLQDGTGVEYHYWDEIKVGTDDFSSDPSTY